MLEHITTKDETGDEPKTRVGAQRTIEATLRIDVDDYLARHRTERDGAEPGLVVPDRGAREIWVPGRS